MEKPNDTGVKKSIVTAGKPGVGKPVGILGKMDRFIIGKFLGTFFFTLTMLMSIAVVFDMAEKIDDFIKYEAPLKAVVLDYYLNFVLYYSNNFSFLFIFISVIYFTSKMAKNNEIIAILSSGVSFNRMLVPFMIAASILVAMSIYLNHEVLPKANKIRLEFEDRYAHNPLSLANVHREVEPGVIVYFNNNAYGYLDGYCMENWKEGELKSILYAQRAYGDTITNDWKLSFYFIRYLGKEKDSILRGDNMDTTFNFNVKDLGYRNEYASSMTSSQLRKFIDEERAKGSGNIAISEIELHQRTAYPIATFILTLIAVCVAGRKSRGGTGLQLAIGLILAVTYIFSMKMTTVAAMKAGMNASLAVWIPNVLFLLFTIPLYRRAQK